jgi:dolichol-phosphate mannosyltransferase
MASIFHRLLRSPVQTIKEEQTLVKFLMVGVSGTAVNLVASYYLHFLIGAIFAQAVGVELSIVSNFFWNDSYTFRYVAKETPIKYQYKLQRLMKYNALSVGTAALNLFIFYLLAYPLGLNHGIWYAVSSLVAVLVAFVFNYLGSSKWAWKAKQP